MKRGISILLLMFLLTEAYSQDDEIKLSLDKLFSLQVTTVSGTAMEMKKSPAAIYVITSEDFKEQGHRTIAEALQAVPGFHVKRIDSSKFSITARGSAGRFASKLLLLIDGRSAYTPLFSGVYWEIQDMAIEDIDRIEVIRGPGATLWGANAVNGVVNVVTKNTRDIEGGYLKLGSGSHADYETEMRWADQLTDDLFYKVSGKAFRRDGSEGSNGLDANDSWDSRQLGIRLDWYVTPVDTHTFQLNLGDYTVGSSFGVWTDSGLFATGPATGVPNAINFNPGGAPSLYTIVEQDDDTKWKVGNFMWVWNKSLSANSGWTFKTYYDYTDYESVIYDEERQTIDLDFRHWFNINKNNSFIWGLSFRTTDDDINGTQTVTVDPLSRRVNTYSGFVQNTTQVTDKLSLMYGSKLEYNDLSLVEIQPSIRLTYEFTEETVGWLSWSRAVRRPSRADDDLLSSFTQPELEYSGGLVTNGVGIVGVVPDNTYLPLSVNGSKDFDSEELIAYEAGIRTTFWNKRIGLDFAIFYNDYDNLRNYKQPDPTDPTVYIANGITAETYGAELSLKIKAAAKLDLMFNYTWYKEHESGVLREDRQSTSRNLLFSQVSYEFLKDFFWHTNAFYSDQNPDDNVESFLNLNTGLVWDFDQNWSFSAWGRNLLDPQHTESIGGFYATDRYQIPRSFFFEATYKF